MTSFLEGLGYRQQKPPVCWRKGLRWSHYKAACPSAVSVMLKGGTEIEAMLGGNFLKALYGPRVAKDAGTGRGIRVPYRKLQ